MNFEEWYAEWPAPVRSTNKEDMQAAWDAATFTANNRAGDSANEGEKDARRSVAVDKILTEWVDQFTRWKAGKPELDAIIKEAQG